MESSAIAFYQPALMSMDDFELANPYAPPPSKTPPLARLQANTGLYASLFNTACQAKGLMPEFRFKEPNKGTFVVTLLVDHQVLNELGPYASKKDAKEDICRVSIARLEEFQNRKPEPQTASTPGFARIPATLNEENWTSTLVEYCQRNKLPYATYTESNVHPSLGPHFCTVRISDSPITEFGSSTTGFKNKKDAKKNASMEAVLWLRGQGRLQGGTAPAQGADEGLMDTSGLLPALHDALIVNTTETAPQGSIGKQVQDLCLSLGFHQPEFEITPLAGAFYNVHARFTPKNAQLEPRLAGAVAPVSNVFGKKAAKDECWRELLRVLESIRRSRLLPIR